MSEIVENRTVSAATPSSRPAGHLALWQRFKLRVPPPRHESYVGPGSRRTAHAPDKQVEYYPLAYWPGDTAAAHLKFALKNEPLDLRILIPAFRAMDPEELSEWLKREPTGIYGRRAWFLYEHFTGKTLPLDSLRQGNYANLLDEEAYVCGPAERSARHRIINNLLGVPGWCPLVRRTPRLQGLMATPVREEAERLVQSVEPELLVRAVTYLYNKETRSSFQIEREIPSKTKSERFIAALQDTLNFDPTFKGDLVGLQNRIVDPRYAVDDWRDFQNFVGETLEGYREEIRFICPRPEDVPGMMDDWARMTERVLASDLDPVTAAAIISFSFVFIHPFEDGNGRIHRYLLHHVLARKQMTPKGIIFPVSASIARDTHGYDVVLAGYSKPIHRWIQWEWTENRDIEVLNDTHDLYAYFDATALVEYTSERVIDTLRKDLRDELAYLALFDRVYSDVCERFDMPNRRAQLLVQLCLQNQGRLSARKRAQFAELSDSEVAELEETIRAAKEGMS